MKRSTIGMMFVFFASLFLLLFIVAGSSTGFSYYHIAFETGKTLFFFSIMKLLLVFGIFFAVFSGKNSEGFR